jgi:hypothetical protein
MNILFGAVRTWTAGCRLSWSPLYGVYDPTGLYSPRTWIASQPDAVYVTVTLCLILSMRYWMTRFDLTDHGLGRDISRSCVSHMMHRAVRPLFLRTIIALFLHLSVFASPFPPHLFSNRSSLLVSLALIIFSLFHIGRTFPIFLLCTIFLFLFT